MIRTPLLFAAAAAALALPAMASAQVQSGAVPTVPAAGPILHLSINESIDSKPDLATVHTGVQTRAMTAKDAMALNAAQMDKLIAALIKAGIERKDIQTSGINLNPQYDYSNRTENQNGPKFLGYEASNQLSVKIRKIDKAGELVDTMVGAGATNINGPMFGIDKPDTLLDQARVKALKTAQERANLYAQATGYRSARLIGISEGGGVNNGPIIVSARAMSMDGAQTKIEPGQISTSISLGVQYMLER